MTDIDPATGLPQLPENHRWVIEEWSIAIYKDQTEFEDWLTWRDYSEKQYDGRKGRYYFPPAPTTDKITQDAEYLKRKQLQWDAIEAEYRVITKTRTEGRLLKRTIEYPVIEGRTKRSYRLIRDHFANKSGKVVRGNIPARTEHLLNRWNLEKQQREDAKLIYGSFPPKKFEA